jgi:hypothetical protein
LQSSREPLCGVDAGEREPVGRAQGVASPVMDALSKSSQDKHRRLPSYSTYLRAFWEAPIPLNSTSIIFKPPYKLYWDYYVKECVHALRNNG